MIFILEKPRCLLKAACLYNSTNFLPPTLLLGLACLLVSKKSSYLHVYLNAYQEAESTSWEYLVEEKRTKLKNLEVIISILHKQWSSGYRNKSCNEEDHERQQLKKFWLRYVKYIIKTKLKIVCNCIALSMYRHY